MQHNSVSHYSTMQSLRRPQQMQKSRDSVMHKSYSNTEGSKTDAKFSHWIGFTDLLQTLLHYVFFCFFFSFFFSSTSHCQRYGNEIPTFHNTLQLLAQSLQKTAVQEKIRSTIDIQLKEEGCHSKIVHSLQLLKGRISENSWYNCREFSARIPEDSQYNCGKRILCKEFCASVKAQHCAA